MNVIAFQSEVKDDVIHIPEEYRGVFSSPVLRITCDVFSQSCPIDTKSPVLIPLCTRKCCV